MEEGIERWLKELQDRLNNSHSSIRREQALLELLVKITNLMKTGRFREAAYLRTEFEKMKTGNYPAE